MTLAGEGLSDLLRGPLTAMGTWPLLLAAKWCNLRPAFLPKGQVGRHFRAVSRNGRVLVASDMPLEAMSGRVVSARFQTWHKAILPEELPVAWGVLLCIRAERGSGAAPMYEARLVHEGQDDSALILEVGGLRVLEINSLHSA
jgi:hypothetical protein